MRFLTVCALTCLIAPAALQADGMIFPIQPPTGPDPIYINMVDHNVKATIKDNICTVLVDEVFQNPYDYTVEGQYIFPIPRGAALSKFSMFIGDQEVQGEVLERDEARRIYEEIVRKRVDPALLEYFDHNLFRASVAPIEARGERRVVLRYEQILERVGEFYEFWYPLKIEGLTKDPIRELSIVVELETKDPMKTVFSPTHDVKLGDRRETSVVAAYERNNIRPVQDFVMYFSTSRDEFDISALSFREKGEDGYFLLTLSPGLAEEEKVIEKDIVFTLDISGSMEDDDKIESAKSALSYLLGSLGEGDRFGLITFETDVNVFNDRLTEAANAAVKEAKDYVEDLSAGGGTNINDALLRALEYRRDSKRPFYIVFLTDGMPTVGVTEEVDIVSNIQKELTGAKLFVFGVGYDVNTHLLDKLSEASKGVSEYVRPDEDLELILTDFYGKIAYPALTELTLGYGNSNALKIYPDPLPDLFYGGEVVVVGRYKNSGSHLVSLEGHKGDALVRFEDEITLTKWGTEESFIPRLWARRRIGYLLDEIRMHGENNELKDEIVELGVKYGVVTPYTSYLVTEEEALAAPGVTFDHADMAAPSGAGSFAAAKGMGQMKKARTIVQENQRGFSIRAIDGKTFFMKDGVWTDTEYVEGMKEMKLVFGSDSFMDFVRSNPAFAKYMSLGTNMLVVLNGQCYRIVEA
jgi:Ca-activated chloride channel family protein